MSLVQTDSYKLSHKGFMTPGTEVIYSNLTARSTKYLPVPKHLFDDKITFFGLQAFIKEFLIEEFNTKFFNVPKKKAIARLKRLFTAYVGMTDYKHFEELHDLGYLPIIIKALPEGSRVNIRVPFLTIENTDRRFAWLTNYLETVMSCELWKPTTIATIIREYRALANRYAIETTGTTAGTEFQIHGFEFRGMSGRHDAARCGAAFLLSSNGTDTIPAIEFLEDYYNADVEKEFIATSVPASEHSLASTGIATEGELATLKRWVTESYPTGIVSIISDTMDFWKVITEYVPALKEDILNRKTNELGLAKVVLRPDSGDPVKILTGYKVYPGLTVAGECAGELDAAYSAGFEVIVNERDEYFELVQELDGVRLGRQLQECEVKGAVECLWDTFGGTTTEQGYKLLHERIGLIYGDSITIERAEAIFKRLKAKGFASLNCVLGVGSYTSQYVTRDSAGMAVKATYAEVDGKGYALFKDPKTDDGTKKSAKGLLRVEKEGDDFVLYDEQTRAQSEQGELKVVFENGILVKETSLEEIRALLWS